MSELVEELRNGWKRMGETGHQLYARTLFDRSADELTSLRARVLVLEGALEEAKDQALLTMTGFTSRLNEIVRICDQGLSQDQGREGYGVSGGILPAAPDGATEGQCSAGDGAIRAAFRAGWYVNALEPPDQTEEYLAACEASDFRDYCAALEAKL